MISNVSKTSPKQVEQGIDLSSRVHRIASTVLFRLSEGLPLHLLRLNLCSCGVPRPQGVGFTAQPLKYAQPDQGEDCTAHEDTRIQESAHLPLLHLEHEN